jgi:hypothetical protein
MVTMGCYIRPDQAMNGPEGGGAAGTHLVIGIGNRGRQVGEIRLEFGRQQRALATGLLLPLHSRKTALGLLLHDVVVRGRAPVAI